MARFTKPATAVVVMGAIIAVLLMLCTPRSTSRRSALDGTDTRSPTSDTARPPRP